MEANKRPLVKRSLRLLVHQMRPDDRIALAVYADAAGSTNGGTGLQLAYQVAELNKIEGGTNRGL